MEAEETTTRCVCVCVCPALTDGVLGQEVHGVGVEEAQEGSVDGVGELLDLDHVLLVLRPPRAEHGAEVFAPAAAHRTKQEPQFKLRTRSEPGHWHWHWLDRSRSRT